MSLLLVALVVCLLCFSRGMEASTTVTIVTTSSTTTTTTKTEPTITVDTSTQPAPQKCPVLTSESDPAAQKTGSIQEKFLHLSVDPMTITEGSTGHIDINCTFWAKPEAQVFKIVIIGIYRLRDVKTSFGLEKQEVVTATPGNKKHETIKTENLYITKHVDITGLSYVNLTIISPTSKDIGLYRCSVLGSDIHKEPFFAQTSIQVGPRASIEPAPSKEFASTSPPRTDGNPEPDVNLAQLKKQVESLQLAFGKITKQVADMENFQVNVNARLANIKSSLFLDPLVKDNVEYVVSKTDFTSYTNAQAACEIFGGFLAETDTHDEFATLFQYLEAIFEEGVTESSNAEVEGVLIGGTLNEENGSPNWSNSHSVNDSSYFRWIDGILPIDPTKKCIVLLKESTWDMSDQACRNEKSHFRFICEIPRRK